MLHTKYRPKNFSEVYGQEQNLATLRKQVETRNYSSAYIFAGHRGTGKTSIARILARAMCCEHPTVDGPCNTCRNCRMILEEKTMDFIELDAASNNTIADIKELVASTTYLPAVLPKKIYIIDEVHNLSTNAFDALLKTIEEPPEHCVFILCTTELHKIPATIRSRCSNYKYSALTIDVISQRLSYVLNDIGKKYENEALELIAQQAEGSLRDALSICERLILTADVLTCAHVREALFLIDDSIKLKIAECIINQDICSGIDYLQKIYEDGNNLSQLTETMIQCFTDCIVLKSIGNSDKDKKDNYHKQLLSVIQDTDISLIFWYTDQFCKLKETIRNTINPYMDVMLTLIKCCNPELLDEDKAYLLHRIYNLEKTVDILSKRLENITDKSEVTENTKKEPVSTPEDNDGFVETTSEEIPFREGEEEGSSSKESEESEESASNDIFSQLLESCFF